MARVFLTSTVPDSAGGSYQRLGELAERDRIGMHTLTDDPVAADLILFAETAWGNELLLNVRRHSLLKAHRDKTFVQCELDGVVPYLPGIYTAVPRRHYRPDRVRSGSYLVMYANPAVTADALPERPRWLFSFVGSSRTAPVRQQILALRHPRALIADVADRPRDWYGEDGTATAFQQRYAETLRDSAFVLCPAGHSPSTVRLFEVLRTGRVPVVISDEWVPPVGPDWDSCCVRVPEDEVASIPERLEALEPRADAMGRAARRAHDEWFADDVVFHRTIEWCLDIACTRTISERFLRWSAYSLFIDPPYLVGALRYARSRLRYAARRLRPASPSP